MLGFIPFLHPLAATQQWWYLLLAPLAFGISVIYKAVRMPALDGYWKQVAIMTAQIVLAMVGLAVGLIVLVQVIIPRLPVD